MEEVRQAFKQYEDGELDKDDVRKTSEPIGKLVLTT
jgi:hypothetical protein